MQIRNSNTYTHHAFGLNIKSGIRIPEFCGIPPGLGTCRENAPRTDVRIRWGNVPLELESPEHTGVRFQVKSNEFLLTVDNVARYYVARGETITIAPCPGAKEKDIRLFLLGSVFGGLFHQRGVFPLHGSAVEINQGGVVFCGRSGQGKSTTARAMVKRGYRFHTDDISPILLNGSGTEQSATVLPAFPHLKLWEDTLKKSGDDSSKYSRVRSNINKYSIPVPDKFTGVPLPLKKIYILDFHQRNDISIAPVTGMEKLIFLKQNTYRLNYIHGKILQGEHFKFTAELANLVKVSKVLRPRDNHRINELADVLEVDSKS